MPVSEHSWYRHVRRGTFVNLGKIGERRGVRSYGTGGETRNEERRMQNEENVNVERPTLNFQRRASERAILRFSSELDVGRSKLGVRSSPLLRSAFCVHRSAFSSLDNACH